MVTHSKIFKSDKSALLIIDIQERLLPVIYESERVVQNAVKLVKGFQVLGVPIYYTEQYPKGLGSTSAVLKEALGDLEPINKMTFSCYGAGNLFEELKKNEIEQLAVCGTEAHVCVTQTVLDLIANGFSVHVAADAISSRRKFDFDFAVERMRSNGAEITLTESILFEMLNVCGTEQFKAISKIVK